MENITGPPISKDIQRDIVKDTQRHTPRNIQTNIDETKKHPTPSKRKEIPALAGIGSWIEKGRGQGAEKTDQERAEQPPMSRWLGSDSAEEPWSATRGVERAEECRCR
ncbi:hypothetical protein EG328_004925 [Venturia inaequalis]|uniref:Uncharacterized protein n=1 Tax=Venturia inaequalis TaxID=5025 RepID=A0A8H3UKN7_VENIN|nr:hypothetical protein EG328_004925 [Venturia inaequalis]RDI78084.1 hypothetical protein Vi05172_g12007 [Venturia inaequalis]